LICDETAALKESKPSVGIRMQGKVEAILGPAVLVREGPEGFLGLSAEDEFKLQVGFPWCSPTEAG
jgi:hypothetical protein